MSNAISLTVSKSVLLSAINNVQSAIANRNLIEILSHLKLEATNGHLSITASDMDISIIDTIPASISISGALTVSANIFGGIIKKMPDNADIEIRGDAGTTGRVQIKSKGCKFTLPCLKIDDFPVIEKEELDSKIKIQSKEFLKLINKSKFAMSNDELKYFLNGINLKSEDNMLIATATNGHKLGMIKSEIFNNIDFPNIIMPFKAVGILSSLLGNSNNEIDIYASKEKMIFKFNNITLITKLIDGSFPDMQNIVPSNNTSIFTINKNLLSSSINRISTVSSERESSIKFCIFKNKLIISAESEELGAGDEELEIVSNIDNLNTNFNFKFINEILNNIKDDEVQFSFSSDNRKAPVLINSISVKDKEVYIVMPMFD